MRVKIVRVAQGKQSTLSHLYIDGIFQCYLLEDKIRAEKIKHQTAIPTGNFQLRLNTWGGMNTKYKTSMGKVHEGMIEIYGFPNFDYIYIHIGNLHSETSGCPLTGFGFQKVGEDYQVVQSRDAYKMVYPKLVKLIKDKQTAIVIENNFQF